MKLKAQKPNVEWWNEKIINFLKKKPKKIIKLNQVNLQILWPRSRDKNWPIEGKKKSWNKISKHQKLRRKTNCNQNNEDQIWYKIQMK